MRYRLPMRSLIFRQITILNSIIETVLLLHRLEAGSVAHLLAYGMRRHNDLLWKAATKSILSALDFMQRLHSVEAPAVFSSGFLLLWLSNPYGLMCQAVPLLL